MKFSERILPSFGVSLATTALVLATSFAIWAALDTTVAVSYALVASTLSLLWWRSSIHRVTFDGKVLRVNDAQLEVRHISSCLALDPQQWKVRRGPNFDPALFHAHKFWHHSGIELALNDARDPHPGWLIGSKDPARLSEVITASLKDR